MYDKEVIEILVEKLTEDFSISTPIGISESSEIVESTKIIKEFLIERIKILMAKNFERFLNTLYRIDVDEIRLNKALNENSIQEIPEKIADLIIERQIKRITTQLKYKRGEL